MARRSRELSEEERRHPIFSQLRDHLQLSLQLEQLIPWDMADLLLEELENLKLMALPRATLGMCASLDRMERILRDAHGRRERTRKPSNVGAAYVEGIQRLFEISQNQSLAEVARVYVEVVCPEGEDPESQALEALRVALRRAKKGEWARHDREARDKS